MAVKTSCGLLYIYCDRKICVVIFFGAYIRSRLPVRRQEGKPAPVKKIRIPILSFLGFFSKRMLVFEIMIIYSVMKP